MRESLFAYPFYADIYSNNYTIFNKKAPFAGNIRLPNHPEKHWPEK
jgi:hypothetical protein